MGRKPQTGGDRNAWGHVLNDFLDVSHNPDGTIKPEGVQTAVATEVETALGVQLPPAVAAEVAAQPTVAAAAAAAIDAEPRVAANTAAIERVNTQRYDVRTFGTIDTDANTTAAFQAAIDAANAAGGGIVTAPRGVYIFSAGLTIYDDVVLDFGNAGGVVLDFRTATIVSTQAAIYGIGSTTLLPAMLAAVARGDRTIPFVSAPDVVPGDLIQIYNPADFSFSPHRSYYRNGEFAVVATVSGNTITVAAPLFSGYGTTVVINRINTIDTGVKGATFLLPANRQGIKVWYGRNLQLDDLRMSGTGELHISLHQCFMTFVRNVNVEDYGAWTGRNYGLAINNCQSVYVSDSHFNTVRHGITTGGDSSAGCVPCRDIVISETYIGTRDTNSTSAGLDFHGNIEFARVVNCTISGGFNPQGDHIYVENCDIYANDLGRCMNGTEILGMDHQFINCRFHGTDYWTTEGMIYFVATLDTANGGLSGTGLERGGVLTFDGCTLFVNNFRASSGVTHNVMQLYITALSEIPTTADVSIRNMTIRGVPPANGQQTYGAWIRAAGTRAWRSIKVDGWFGEAGVRLEGNGSHVIDVSRYHVDDARWKGLEIIWPAAPVFVSSLLQMDDVRVRRSQHCGIDIRGATDTEMILNNVYSINNNRMGGTGLTSTDSSMFIDKAASIRRISCTVGDKQGTPTQTRVDAITNVTELIDLDVVRVGTVTARNRTAVTSEIVREIGAGAPTRVVSNGSTYLRTDGAAGSTYYVREGGAWVAK